MWILWKCRCQTNRLISLCSVLFFSVPSILYIFQNWGKEIKSERKEGKVGGRRRRRWGQALDRERGDLDVALEPWYASSIENSNVP